MTFSSSFQSQDPHFFNAYLQSSKMNHTVNIRMRRKRLVERRFVGDIELYELGSLATYQLDPIDDFV